MSYTIALTVNFSTPSQSFTAAVESFSFSADIPITASGGGAGGGAGKPTFSVLTINKMLDVNTVALFSNAAQAKAIPTVTLALTKAGSTSPDATYTLGNVLISEVADSGNSHGGQFPTEQVLFAFQTIKITSGGATFNFDVSTNKGG